jgi:hypothetical protein
VWPAVTADTGRDGFLASCPGPSVAERQRQNPVTSFANNGHRLEDFGNIQKAYWFMVHGSWFMGVCIGCTDPADSVGIVNFSGSSCWGECRG